LLTDATRHTRAANAPQPPAGPFVGTCGWSYPEWADHFYVSVPRKDWLAHYAAHFDAVEVDASFYHSLRRSTYAGWRERTPAGFRFVVKANRFLTHVRRLDFGDGSLARERDAIAALGDKLALVLWQLPAALHAFLARFAAWPDTRHVLEFRHASWCCDEVAAALAAHRVAVCQSDAPDWPLWQVVTADVVLLRLHGHAQTYRSTYDEAELRDWARQIGSWQAAGHATYVFFDNTAAGHAPRDAARLVGSLAGGRTGG
jgi:uncharacterized protein YecE (DUF72 family)